MISLTPVKVNFGALDRTQFLPLANKIADLVAAQVNRGIGMSFESACQLADYGLDPAQRLYESEINQAGLILGDMFPGASVDAWIIHLRNNMAHRLTDVMGCHSSQIFDPVMRVCLDPEPEPEPEPEPQPHPQPHTKAGLFGDIDKKWLYLGGLALLVLLLKR